MTVADAKGTERKNRRSISGSVARRSQIKNVNE